MKMKMINYYENENSRDVGNLYYDKETLMKVRGKSVKVMFLQH